MLDIATLIYVLISEKEDELIAHTNGDTIREASNAHDYIDKTLGTMSTRFHNYQVPVNELISPISVSARMLFRPFKPYILNESNPDLMLNVPIYEMYQISKEINITDQ